MIQQNHCPSEKKKFQRLKKRYFTMIIFENHIRTELQFMTFVKNKRHLGDPILYHYLIALWRAAEKIVLDQNFDQIDRIQNFVT